MGKHGVDESALRASQVIWRTVVLAGAMLGGACGGAAPPAETTPAPAATAPAATTEPAPEPPARDEDSLKRLGGDGETVENVFGADGTPLAPVADPPAEPPAPPAPAATAPSTPTKAPAKKRKSAGKPAPKTEDSSDPCAGGEVRPRGTDEDGPPRGRGFVLA